MVTTEESSLSDGCSLSFRFDSELDLCLVVLFDVVLVSLFFVDDDRRTLVGVTSFGIVAFCCDRSIRFEDEFGDTGFFDGAVGIVGLRINRFATRMDHAPVENVYM